MTEGQRIIKRLIIIVVYLAIVASVAAGLYFLFRTKPTCTDGKHNQGEEKIDCGGPCAKCEEIPVIGNLNVVEKAIMPAGTNKYDILVKLENPNAQFGVANFDYSFSLLEKSGKIVSEKKGSSFILPGQAKYLFAFNLESQKEPESFDFKISSFRWTKFSEYREPDISIYSKELNLISSGAGFAQLKGKMRNQSGYDFRKISVKAALRDEQSKPVAINETSFNDVKVGEEREIYLNWMNPFPVDPNTVKIEVESEVDVFSSDNFMKKYGTQQQYESYEVK